MVRQQEEARRRAADDTSRRKAEAVRRQEEARRRAAEKESQLKAEEIRQQEEDHRWAADEKTDISRALQHAADVETVFTVCERNWLDLDGVNVVQALHRVAKSLGNSPDMQALFRPDPRLSSLVHLLPSRLPALPPKGFSNIAWALGVLRWKDPQLMTLLANETVRRI